MWSKVKGTLWIIVIQGDVNKTQQKQVRPINQPLQCNLERTFNRKIQKDQEESINSTSKSMYAKKITNHAKNQGKPDPESRIIINRYKHYMNQLWQLSNKNTKGK